MGPRLPYGSWKHGLSLDTRPPMYPAVTGHGLKLSSSLALEELQTGGVCAGRLGGGVQDGAQLTRALQLMQGEARGQPHRDRGKVGRGDGVCAARPVLGPVADRAGATAHRVEGKSGPGAGEGSGCPEQQPATSCKGTWCRMGSPEWEQGLLGGLGSVRDLGVGRQSTFAAPVSLPEAPVQLLQLWAQREVASQVHAEGLQPLLQLHKGGPEVTRGRDREGGFWLRGGTANPQGCPMLSPTTLTSSQGPDRSSAR